MRKYIILLAAAVFTCSCTSRGPSGISDYRWDPDNTDEAIQYEELMLASIEFDAVDTTSAAHKSRSVWARFRDSRHRGSRQATGSEDGEVTGEPLEVAEPAPIEELTEVEEPMDSIPPSGEVEEDTPPRRRLFGLFGRRLADRDADPDAGAETTVAAAPVLPPLTPMEFFTPPVERGDPEPESDVRATRRGLFGLFRRNKQADEDADYPADLVPPEWAAEESATSTRKDDQEVVPGGDSAPVFRPIAPGELVEDPVIRPGHVLSIEVVVSGRKEIEELDKRVSAAGYISLPLAGTVECNGMTPATLAIKLQRVYSEYMRDPMVDVCFVVDHSEGAVSPWGSVTVLGQVRTPGRINIPPTQDLSLSMAVQLAGGLDASAKDTAIRVTRRLENGSLDTVIVNLRSAASDSRVENDILLHADDIIYVPEKVF